MKKALFLSLVFLLTSHISRSGEIKYKISDIPAGLKENARSVLRLETVEFTVEGLDKARLKVFSALTVLNKNGLEDANFEEYYDKFRIIGDIKGRVFNENGEVVKRFTGTDIKDYSAIAGYSLFEDNRVKFIDPEIRQFPFTVEYSYEIEYKGITDFPDWFPMVDYNISVEKCSFKVIIPKSLEFRYFERNLPAGVNISSIDLNNIYYWELSSQKAIKFENFGPSRYDYFPLVLISPTDFEKGGYKGNSSSWKNLGEWFYTLNEGKDLLLPETVAELNGLVKDCRDTQDKIAKLYGYMQGRVRYVNLTVGLGGLQPIDAATVHRLGYGDCKALTNYMKALLKAVGINSYYCLVKAGRASSEIIADFPSFQFNHAILCVPVNQDTTWLECTSQHLPPGYLGTFTDDRYALLVDKSNSHLVRTEKIPPEENLEKCIAGIVFDETGSGSINISRKFSGVNYDDALHNLLADDNDKKKMISQEIIFPSFQLVDFKYDEFRGQNPFIVETINVNFENYLTSLNNKFILTLNCTNKISSSFTSSRNRKAEIVIREEYTILDSLAYNIPATLKIESLPEAVEITAPFGHYQSQVVPVDNFLIYIRTLHINKGVYPAASYADLVDFVDRILVADDEKCVFVRKE